MRLFVSVGEASADRHAALLIRALRERIGDLEVFGFGGEHLKREGMEILYPLPSLALIGFVEVIKHLPQIREVRSVALKAWQARQPDAILLVDYPGFHLRLARKAHEWGLPVYYYIAPQAWAWKEGRVQLMRKVLEHLYVIFPFEEDFFGRRGVPTTFVGHPLLERLPDPAPMPSPLEAALKNPAIGLLPGSRKNELRNLLPAMVKAAIELRKVRPQARFLLFQAETLSDDFLAKFDLPGFIEVVKDPDYAQRRELTLAWTKSGTGTVENALLEIPMAVVYRSGMINAFLARRFVRVPYIGMVNLIAQKGICPEFIQEQYQPQMLARFADELLASTERYAEMKADLARVRAKLGTLPASQYAADQLIHHWQQSGRLG